MAVAVPLAGCAQTPADRCPTGDSFRSATAIERDISEFHVQILKDAGTCAFQVRDRNGKIVAGGSNAQVEAFPEMYVLSIGTNDLVIETFSGGAHCCWTYYIVTQLPTPHVAAKIENQQPVDFMDFRGIELNDLVTGDGIFHEFEGLPNAMSPFPRVYLRFVRGKLRDVSTLYKGQYDTEVADLKKHLSPEQLQRFRARAPGPLKMDEQMTASYVLSIVLDYLYSGREEQAWKELAEMWPPGDVERIKREILKARENGILRYTRD